MQIQFFFIHFGCLLDAWEKISGAFMRCLKSDCGAAVTDVQLIVIGGWNHTIISI